MKIHRNLPKVDHAVITIGSFDGVHLGHQHLINQTILEAKSSNLEDYILTFEPHPRLVIPNNEDFRLLTTLEEKIIELEKLGVSNLIIIPFNDELSKKSAEEFILDYIIKPLNPMKVILGYDHKFGKDRKGSQETFIAIKEKLNLDFELIKIEEFQSLDLQISSTTIRNKIKSQEIHEANQILGRTYSLRGRIVEGKKLGRTIEYPTANLAIDHDRKLIPSNGVYQTRIKIDNTIYHSATSIGYNPTVTNDLELKIETFILDFNQDIYGLEVDVYFEKMIREERKFESMEAMVAEIKKDISIIRSNI